MLFFGVYCVSKTEEITSGQSWSSQTLQGTTPIFIISQSEAMSNVLIKLYLLILSLKISILFIRCFLFTFIIVMCLAEEPIKYIMLCMYIKSLIWYGGNIMVSLPNLVWKIKTLICYRTIFGKLWQHIRLISSDTMRINHLTTSR